jgi:hypothetical protein
MNVNMLYRYERFGDEFIRCDNKTLRRVLAVLDASGVVLLNSAFQTKREEAE